MTPRTVPPGMSHSATMHAAGIHGDIEGKDRSKDLPLRASGDTAEAQVLDLEVLLDPVLGALAAEAALLDAAKRRHLRRDEAGVDADHARLEPLGHAEHP